MLRKFALWFLALWVGFASNVTLPVTEQYFTLKTTASQSRQRSEASSLLPTSAYAQSAECASIESYLNNNTATLKQRLETDTKYLNEWDTGAYQSKKLVEIAEDFTAFRNTLLGITTNIEDFARKDCGKQKFFIYLNSYTSLAATYNSMVTTAKRVLATKNFSDTEKAQIEPKLLAHNVVSIDYDTLKNDVGGASTCLGLIRNGEVEASKAENSMDSAEDTVHQWLQSGTQTEGAAQALTTATEQIKKAADQIKQLQTKNCHSTSQTKAAYDALKTRTEALAARLQALNKELGSRAQELQNVAARTIEGVAEQCGCEVYTKSGVGTVWEGITEGAKALFQTLMSPLCFLACGVLEAVTALLKEVFLPLLAEQFCEKDDSACRNSADPNTGNPPTGPFGTDGGTLPDAESTAPDTSTPPFNPADPGDLSPGNSPV